MREGWNRKPLGDVCEMIKRGIAPKYLDDGGACVVNQKCVRNHQVNFDLSRRHNIQLKKIPNERYIQVGDVLVNSTGTGTLGRVAQIRSIPSEPSTVDTHVTIVRPIPGKFHPDFFGYMMIQIEDEITDAGEGASGQTELARTSLQNNFHVSYPNDKAEQKRIVAILDEAFEGIDAAIANTEKNLLSARELFERYSDSIFAGNRQGWSETTLGEIADFKNGLNFTKSSKGRRVYIVGVKEFQSNYWVPTEELNSVQIDGELSENYELRKNDILTVRSNGNKQLIGRCMLVRDVPEKTSHSGFTIRIRNHSQDIEPTYLAHYLKSSAVREMLVNSGGGANISSLNQKTLSSLPLLFPSNEEQLKIVARTEAVKADTNLLVANYLNKLSLLSQFKQSLLAKAFSGELTAQPDYILKEAV